MTIPILMNCEHSGEGWCLACVKKLHESKVRLRTTEDLPGGRYAPIPALAWNQEEMVDAMQALIEINHQAPLDFCGQQREFFLPRIQKLFLHFSQLFHKQAVAAMQQAKDGWGEPI